MMKHYSAEQWEVWVGEQRGSAPSVAEFCEWIGVLLNSFYRWRKLLESCGRRPTGDGLARGDEKEGPSTRITMCRRLI